MSFSSGSIVNVIVVSGIQMVFCHWLYQLVEFVICIDIVFLQPNLEEFSFNPLRSKQINHLHVYFKKSHNSLKMPCD